MLLDPPPSLEGVLELLPSSTDGCDVAGLKGNTTKKPSKISNPDEVRDVPSHIVKNYLKVSLHIDVMHVNEIIFLVGVSKYIGLI